MIGDFEQLIRDADPARDLSPCLPNPAAIRASQTRPRQRRGRRPLVGAIGLAFSVAVVIAVVALVVGVRPGAPTRQLGAAGHHTGTKLIARVLPSRYYCSRRGGRVDLPCGARPPQGFVHVGVTSEVLVETRFSAPIAVDSRHRFYEATFRLTRSAGCDAASLGTPSLSSIHAGQRVTLQTFVPDSCSGVVRVVVRYVPDYRTPQTAAVLPPGTRVIGRAHVLVR